MSDQAPHKPPDGPSDAAAQELPPELGDALERPAFAIPDLSGSVLSAFLKGCEDAPPCQYDAEFVSTYIDCQLEEGHLDEALCKQRIGGFEQHLPICAPCTDLLAGLTDVSDAIRRAAVRLDSALPVVDCTADVMAAFSATRITVTHHVLDETTALPVGSCGYGWETWSAYADAQVDRTETGISVHSLVDHIAACPPCKGALTAVTHLQAEVHGTYRRWLSDEKTFGDQEIWPTIAGKLENESALQPSLVYQLRAMPLRRRWGIAAVGAAAAAIVLLLLPPTALSPTLQRATPSARLAARERVPGGVDIAALEAAMKADERDPALNRSVVGQTATVSLATYRTPEAFLMDPANDPGDENSFSPDQDVSAVALRD